MLSYNTTVKSESRRPPDLDNSSPLLCFLFGQFCSSFALQLLSAHKVSYLFLIFFLMFFGKTPQFPNASVCQGVKMSVIDLLKERKRERKKKDRLRAN